MFFPHFLCILDLTDPRLFLRKGALYSTTNIAYHTCILRAHFSIQETHWATQLYEPSSLQIYPESSNSSCCYFWIQKSADFKHLPILLYPKYSLTRYNPDLEVPALSRYETIVKWPLSQQSWVVYNHVWRSGFLSHGGTPFIIHL